MKLVRQPPNSNCCGQACIATIAGLTLDESIALCGTKGKTRTRHLVKALKEHGFEPYENATRISKRSSWIDRLWKSATLVVKFKNGKSSHWVVRHKGKFYDPASGVHRDVPRYLESSRSTSFLIVNKAEGLAA